jgi:hypothetical protein
MTNRDNRDPGWVFDNLLESRLESHPDGMVALHLRATAEHGDRIEAAIAAVAAELPRAAETTDDQHNHDAFVEMCKRRVAEVDRLNEAIRADLTSDALQAIRAADESNDAVRRRVKPREPWR